MSINLDLKPLAITIGPVLPYEQFAYSILEIRNPSEYDTELYSLEYDTTYLKDEEMISSYPALEQSDFVLM